MSTQKPNTPKRQAISLETKIKILDCLNRGEGSTSVGKKFGLNEATIRTIRKNEDSIRQSIISGSELSCKKSSYSRNPILEKTEKYLVFWIEDLLKKNIPIDGTVIKEKALRIYSRIQESEQLKSLETTKNLKFNASDGWLRGFLKRHAFHNIKIKREVASAGEDATKGFSDKLANIIEQGGYTLDEIFNADETGLFWKKLPEKTNLAKTKKSSCGSKAAKDPLAFSMQETYSNKDDLMEVIMTVYDKNYSNNDEDQVQVLTADLICEGLKFAKRLEQHFLTHDPDIERALKFQRNLRHCVAEYQQLYKRLGKPKKPRLITDFMTTKKPSQAVNGKRNSSFDESNFNPVPNKRALFSSSDDE